MFQQCQFQQKYQHVIAGVVISTTRKTRPQPIPLLPPHGISSRNRSFCDVIMNRDIHKVQAQIRQNASSLQDSLREMAAWEDKVKKKDADIKARKGKRTIPAVRGSGGRVVSSSSGVGGAVRSHPFLRGNQTAVGADESKRGEREAKKAPASHVYDKGYKKWENFDVDAALQEVDADNKEIPNESTATSRKPEFDSPAAAARARRAAEKAAGKRVTAAKPAPAVPQVSREELERQDGNALYSKGDFNGAIKCYTRCIGLNPENHIAYSNRAMAYLKAKNFSKAEEDCCSAIRFNPEHVKSWNRRGTARNKLGRHRAAMRDFEQVLRLEPRNKQAIKDLHKTREIVKEIVKRAPRKSVAIRESGGRAIPWVSKPAEESAQSSGGSGIEAVAPGTYSAASGTYSAPATKIAPPRTPSVPKTEANEEVTQKAQAAVRQRARDIALAEGAPSTLFDFNRNWKSLQKDTQGKIQYLSKLPRKAMKKIFKGEVDPELFMEMLRLGDLLAMEKMLDLLDSFASGGGLSMLLMFLNTEDKNLVKQIASRAVESCTGRDSAVKAINRVRKAFL